VVEDAPAGIRAGRAAGMKVIGITSTYPAPELADADAIINRLNQIQVSRNGHSGPIAIKIR
jgi:sugar-phosphatase